MKTSCKRCGLCCIIHPCYAFSGYDENSSDDFDCPFLVVHEDMTTSCTNEDAKEAFIGSGCILESAEGQIVKEEKLSMYAIKERKEILFKRRCQHGSCNSRETGGART